MNAHYLGAAFVPKAKKRAGRMTDPYFLVYVICSCVCIKWMSGPSAPDFGADFIPKTERQTQNFPMSFQSRFQAASGCVWEHGNIVLPYINLYPVQTHTSACP